MDVGCIGVLIRDGTGNVSAGLSVSAPIARRRLEWIEALIEAGRSLSAQLGYRADGEQSAPKRENA
nr:IclR family transcriptional regulator C-terminal domain-containing protein [Allochromatium tepidum]